jgi:hypothetical protein
LYCAGETIDESPKPLQKSGMKQRLNLIIVCLIVFFGLLGAWLKAHGPIDWGSLVTAAQGWQTLMGALIAIGVATIAYQGAKLAYKGAMAKVDFDRDKDRRELESKKLGYLLRARFAAEKLLHDCKQVSAAIGGYNPGGRSISPLTIEIRERAEFEEAWENLQLFSLNSSFQLDKIRTLLPEARKKWLAFQPGVPIHISSLGPAYQSPIGLYLGQAKEIGHAAEKLLAELGFAIAEITPK